MIRRSFLVAHELESLLMTLTDSRAELVDRYLRGLSLIKRKRGGLTWILKFVSSDTNIEQKLKVGRYPEVSLHEARNISIGIIKKCYEFDTFDLYPDKPDLNHEGSNLYKISQKHSLNGLTLNEYFTAHYLPYIKTAKRSWKTDVSVYNNHIKPILGKLILEDIKPYLVQEMLNVLKGKNLSSSSVNRALIILRYAFNLALKWKVIPDMVNPCTGVKELSLNNKKEKFISPSEFFNLKVELQKSKNAFLQLFIQLLLLTGARRGEALNAKMTHLDLGRGDWVVPLPKGGKARHIPLNESAVITVRHIIVAFPRSSRHVLLSTMNRRNRNEENSIYGRV